MKKTIKARRFKHTEHNYNPDLVIPGLSNALAYQVQFLSLLDRDIYSRIESISACTQIMQVTANHIMNELEKIVKEVFPNSEAFCTMYGSLTTGIALETSDVDIAVRGLPIFSSVDLLMCMEQLDDALKQQSFVINTKFINTARVPVIKLTVHTDSNKIMNVDVTFDDSVGDQASPVWYSLKFVEWMKIQSQSLPYLRPLVILLKKLVAVKGYNIPFYGGLGSYVITLMVSAFLRSYPSFHRIADAFMELLRCFGVVFDTEKMYISTDAIMVASTRFNKPSDLVAFDVFRPSLNAASTVTRFVEIKQLFFDTRSELIRAAPNCGNLNTGEILNIILKEG